MLQVSTQGRQAPQRRLGHRVALAVLAAVAVSGGDGHAQGRDYSLHIGARVPSLCALRDLARVSPVVDGETDAGRIVSAPLYSGFVVVCNVPGAISLVRVRGPHTRVRLRGSDHAMAAEGLGSGVPGAVAALQPHGTMTDASSAAGTAAATNAAAAAGEVELGSIAVAKGRTQGAMATGGEFTVMALGGHRIESDSVTSGDEIRVVITGRE